MLCWGALEGSVQSPSFAGLVEQTFYSELIMASFPDQAPLLTVTPGLELEEKGTEIPQQHPKQTNSGKPDASGQQLQCPSQPRWFWGNSQVPPWSCMVTGPCSSAGIQQVHLGQEGFYSIPFLPTEHYLCAL